MRSSTAGAKAATTAVATVASNVANARNASRVEDAAVKAADQARRNDGMPRQSGDELYRPVRADNVMVAAGGVRAVVREYSPPHVVEFDPGNPAADADGTVARPNVDLADQMVRLRQARHMYNANLKTIKTADDMMGYLLDRRA